MTACFHGVLSRGDPHGRYQRQLRLARALALMDEYDDLSALGLDLGFSSHSHFSASFRQAYGLSPSAFRSLHPRGKAIRSNTKETR